MVLLLALAALVIMLYTQAAGDRPARPPAVAANSQAYLAARKKWDNFANDGSVRVLTLSDAETNAILTSAPELAFLGQGVVLVSRDNGIEVQVSVPLKMIPFYTKYVNGDVFLRPIITGENVDLNVYSVDAAGRPLDASSLQRFKTQVEPVLNAILTGTNQFQGNRAIHEIRTQNGTIVLLR